MNYTYQQLFDENGGIRSDMIMRLPDTAFIPSDPDNVDWIAYQAWLNDGNQPSSPV